MDDKFLTDVEISWAEKKTEGIGKKDKPWELYTFRVEGDERYFSWFWNESKPIKPAKGMKIKLMDYVEEQTYSEKHDKEFTNYNVSRIILQGGQPKQETKTNGKVSTGFVGQKTGRDSSLTMYISYAKDLLVAHLLHGDYEGVQFNQLVDMAVDEGVRMYDRAKGEAIPEPEKENRMQDLDEQADYNDNQPPPHTDDDNPIPF